MKSIVTIAAALLMCAASASASTTQAQHKFELGKTDFLLDGKPVQVISGEMHPARIPAEYWRHRIQMAKAMGCNTIAAYVFWNYHEQEPGKFDFKTGNHNIAKFIKICQEEGMWVLVRPGPYVCGEWELGGIPPYLLRTPDIKLRCMDPTYIKAVDRYVKKLAEQVKPLLVTHGGPVLMMQVENEYGSYGNDRTYVKHLHQEWQKNGIDVPFYTADGPTNYMLEAGSLPGCAVGLDSGSSLADWDLAQKLNPGVPVFSSETYPGWLTHWGEQWARQTTEGISSEVKFLLDNHKSFNLYVIHGGTNFGFTAGANSGGNGYEPDITSYDYDAPVNEQGQATPKYLALRKLISSYLPAGKTLPEIPAPIPTVTIPEFTMAPIGSVWNNLPKPIKSPQPKTFEALGQDYGFVLYKTKLIGHKSGKLKLTQLHDYATVFVDGKYVGYLDRREGKTTIDLPKPTTKDPVLEILVEAMGRINFAENLIDRKGITERATLNGMTLMDWELYPIPMTDKWIQSLQPSPETSRPGVFFKGTFNLETPADTFIDVSNFKKGILWVNGHNLGRYWQIGPQKRLYCPAPWLKKGKNEVQIFDQHQTQPTTISGKASLD